MPYYVYRFSNDDKKVAPKLQDQFDEYRAAKDLVKELRNENPDEDLNNFRLIFADDKDRARILLTTQREKPQIEEWES
ncbi:MAG: hypothetical protein KAT25_08810 [Sulfuriflexus sp.]|nr:hypothetical protein [Sulfuriflexus sp.]